MSLSGLRPRLLPIVLGAACLAVSWAGSLPHFHDASDSGHAASCVLHQAASAVQAAITSEPVSPERPVFLWSVLPSDDALSYQIHSLLSGLRGPPAATPYF